MNITAKTKSGLDAAIKYFYNEQWCGHVISEYVSGGFCLFEWFPCGFVSGAHADFDIDLSTIEYRGYKISYEIKSAPTPEFDWDFAHKDYDGAPDSDDIRCGTASSLEDAIQQIDDIEESLDDQT